MTYLIQSVPEGAPTFRVVLFEHLPELGAQHVHILHVDQVRVQLVVRVGGALSLVVDLAEQGRQLRVLKCRFQNMDEGLANGANKHQAAHSINGSAARPVVYPFIHGSAPLDNMAAPDQILEVNSYRT